MKKIYQLLLVTVGITASGITLANAPITCPPTLEYSCVLDSSCPKTRCTLTSAAASPWIFLAPYKYVGNDEPSRTSCSILDPGTYTDNYMVSIYGPAQNVGDVAYCLYGSVTPGTLNFSGLYTPDYMNGAGDWKKPKRKYPTLICVGDDVCEFVEKTQ